MPVLNCPVTSCAYKTEDVDATVEIQLLQMHTSIEPAKATGSIISPFFASVRASRIDLGNRSNDFSETWHEVGGQ